MARCRRFWTRAIPVLAVWLGAPAALALLSYGNCQWNRWVYVFQAYVYPRPKLLGPPALFSGRWREWDWRGRLVFSTDLKMGRRDGKFYWLIGSKSQYLAFFKDNRQHGPDIYTSNYDSNALYVPYSIRWFIDRHEVSADEYRIARRQDSSLPILPRDVCVFSEWAVTAYMRSMAVEMEKP